MSDETEVVSPGRFAERIGRMPRPVSPVPREAQRYQGHRAGIVTRFIACAIDFVVVLVILFAMYASIETVRFLLDPADFSFSKSDGGQFIATILFAGGVLFLYLTVGWWTAGRTYGAHVMGLRVVNYEGGRLSIVVAAARSALCVVFPIGLFWVVISPANRAIADVVLRTSVVHDWRVRRDTDGIRTRPTIRSE